MLREDEINASERGTDPYQVDAGNSALRSHLDRLFLGEGNIEEQRLAWARIPAPRHGRVSLCNSLGRRRRNTP